jgi:hypothetical protein
MEKVAEMSRSFQMVSMVPTQERRSRRGTSRVGESVIDRTASYYPLKRFKRVPWFQRKAQGPFQGG